MSTTAQTLVIVGGAVTILAAQALWLSAQLRRWELRALERRIARLEAHADVHR